MKHPHATLDLETYSEAGLAWEPSSNKWTHPVGGSPSKRGLGLVGAHAYAEHPSTEVLCCSYRLPGQDPRRWEPGLPPPQDLFDFLAAGGVIEFHNAFFERAIWFWVLVRKYGWPELPFYQVRCSMATARVNNLPPALGDLASVLGVVAKDADGKRLIRKFSVPQNPTRKQPLTRIYPAMDPEDFENMRTYCDGDAETEAEASNHPRMRPMTPDELLFWWVDQEINWRGLGVDMAGVEDCIAVLEQVQRKLLPEYSLLTGGLTPSQAAESVKWLRSRSVPLADFTEEEVAAALERPLLPPDCRRVLQIRQALGSASVKKLYALQHATNSDGRVRGVILHHGARTGRPTGDGPQPLNMPKAGPRTYVCDSCDRHCSDPARCLWCLQARGDDAKLLDWNGEGAPDVLEVMKRRDPGLLSDFFGDPIVAIQGALRSLFEADEGKDLIASDYSAIEAVVIAMLAGEQWRIDAFRRKDPIYLLSASKISGVPLEEYLAHKAATGQDHPDRQMGKTAELGLGFGGWIGSWLAFDNSGRFSEEEIKDIILRWRAESPAIVELWGGQERGRGRNAQPELYGMEGHFVKAVMAPGVPVHFRGLTFFMDPELDALFITLLSGRQLTYHSPRLGPSSRSWAPHLHSITYMTWNTNPKYGPRGWIAMETYGGRLAENVVQATAHDILRHGILGLRAAGYPTVLHVYDEIVVEVPEGTGDKDEVERIMSTMPAWAVDWPVRASGGYRAKRYRKG